MATPRYSVGLGTKVLSRARKILGSLFLLSVVLIIAGVHQGVVSGEFDKVFIQPFKQFAADLEKASIPVPTLAPLPVLSPAPSLSPTNTPKNSTTIRTIYNTFTNPPQPIQKTYPTQPPQKSWEERVREMNEKADQEYQKALQAQEEWSKQKSQENQEWFNQQTEAAKQSQDEWWAQKQKELEEWKKQNGF